MTVAEKKKKKKKKKKTKKQWRKDGRISTGKLRDSLRRRSQIYEQGRLIDWPL